MVSASVAVAAVAGCGSGGDGDGEYRVPSESMLPTYNVGDVVEIDKDPDSVGVGDVVVFYPPEGAELNTCGIEHPDNQPCPEPTEGKGETLFIKRIVAKPGDSLNIIGGQVHINGEPQEEDYARLDPNCAICNMEKEITVPPDHLFVMGDNRGVSADSRAWGPIERDWITAKVVGIKKKADDDDGSDGPEIE